MMQAMYCNWHVLRWSRREDREKQKHQLPADGDAANAGESLEQDCYCLASMIARSQINHDTDIRSLAKN